MKITNDIVFSYDLLLKKGYAVTQIQNLLGWILAIRYCEGGCRLSYFLILPQLSQLLHLLSYVYCQFLDHLVEGCSFLVHLAH